MNDKSPERIARASKAHYGFGMVWAFVWTAYVGLFVYGLCDNIRGPIFPDILTSFQLADSTGSLMFALVSLSTLVASHFTRTFLLVKYRHRRVLQIAAITLSISLLALSRAPNFIVFLLISLLFGLSFGVLGIICNILVPLGSSEKNRQRLISGLHSMYALSSLVAPLVVSALAALSFTWRGVLGWASIAPLILFCYTLTSKSKAWHTAALVTPEMRSAKRAKNFAPQIFFAFMLSSYVAAEVMVSSRLPLLVRRTFSNSIETSSLYLTYFFVCLLLGRLLFAILHVKKSLEFHLFASLISSVALVIAGIYIHPIFLSLAGFTMGPFYPLAMTLLSSRFHDDLDAAVTHTVFIQSIFLASMHLLVGFFTQAFGIQTALMAGSGFLVISGILLIAFGRIHSPQTSS